MAPSTENIKELLVKTLVDSNLFRHVAPEMVAQLADRMEIASHDTNETIIKKDDEGTTMYFIISGEVKIHDKEQLLAILGKGEFFGEMSILDHEPRSMSVTTQQPTVTGSISRKELFEIINHFPGMTVELVGFLSRRLRRLNKFMVDQLRNRERELEQLVAERTSDLEDKNRLLEEAIEKIRQSQKQLIMQEKLASLGSLTNGVAHELHNPLNFVNNFSEISKELIEEAVQSGNPEEVLAIGNILKRNLTKILDHGRRAENIIKAMIMHSHSGSGVKDPTDLNQVCEQAVSMISYTAGSQATACPVVFEKRFAPQLPMINVVKRDLSKVLLNILNNSYYEVFRKWKLVGENYSPNIRIITQLKENRILITVADNGDGVAEDQLDKIFEPFFTTKPAGEGVGLGLSISNDIIRSYGGKIAYSKEQKDGSGEKLSVFTISIPLQ